MTKRFTRPEMEKLAASGLQKVDFMGKRGATLVSTDEVIAMAGMLAVSGVLPPLRQRLACADQTKREESQDE